MKCRILIIAVLFTACTNADSKKTPNPSDSTTQMQHINDSSTRDSSSIDTSSVRTTDHNDPLIATVHYNCGGGNVAVVSFYKSKCHIRGMLNEANFDMDLPQVISGSGVRYSDGTHTVWNKGNDVSIDMGSGKSFKCKAQKTK